MKYTQDDVDSLAATLILNHAFDVEFMTIGEAMSDDYDELTREDFTAMQLAVEDAINGAGVQITVNGKFWRTEEWPP